MKPNGYRVSQGATAILWRTTLGKTTTYRGEDHRTISIRNAFGTFTCGYGPASVPSVHWLENVIAVTQDIADAGRGRWFCGGDLNWRKTYEQAVPPDAVVAESTKPTTLRGTWPTRAISTSMTVKQQPTEFISGIPHHGLVSWKMNAKVPQQKLTRLRRTGLYALDDIGIALPEDY